MRTSSTALGCSSTSEFGPYNRTLAPNHVESGLALCEAQNKLVGSLKIRRGADSHAAGGLINHQTIARRCARRSEDRSDKRNGVPWCPTSLDCRRDHSVLHQPVYREYSPKRRP